MRTVGSPTGTPESTRQTHARDELNRKQFVKRTMEGLEQKFQFEFGTELETARAQPGEGGHVNEIRSMWVIRYVVLFSNNYSIRISFESSYRNRIR